MNHPTYLAPWGKTLRWMSALSTLLLLLAVTLPLLLGQPMPEFARIGLVLLLLILPVAVLFVIRSYTVEPEELLIRRLLWTTRLPLAGLQSAEAVPNAMRGSLRLCGNGGLFSYTGWYRNRALGNYRAFVTDLNLTVVLRFASRTVVVSPENPDAFVAELTARRA